MIITKTFDQIKRSVTEEFPIGHVVIGNFLPYAGKVVSVDEGEKTVTFQPATIGELRQRMREIWGFDPEESEEWAEMVEAQREYL